MVVGVVVGVEVADVVDDRLVPADLARDRLADPDHAPPHGLGVVFLVEARGVQHLRGGDLEEARDSSRSTHHRCTPAFPRDRPGTFSIPDFDRSVLGGGKSMLSSLAEGNWVFCIEADRSTQKLVGLKDPSALERSCRDLLASFCLLLSTCVLLCFENL